MSQTVTYEVAKTLKKGDTLYHNIIAFTMKDGTVVPATATVLGRVRKVDSREEFCLPIHKNYGAEIDGAVSRFSVDLWRTVPEKVEPVRVRRQRSVVTEAGSIVGGSEEVLAVTKRVKRTRS